MTREKKKMTPSVTFSSHVRAVARRAVAAMPGTTTRACATHARGGFEAKTRGRRRASRRERAVPRSFFGRSDAEQWLGDALGDGDDTRNASETSSSSSVDAAFASVAKKRRGLALFEAELAKEDEADVDLLKCACYVSMHQNPDLDCEQVRRDIDEMATVVKKRLDDELGPEGERFPLRTIKTLSRAWAHDLGFTGNVEDYYDVENSCIDRVLARRTGIPITLCLTYMEIAKRCGITMVDVGIPGHLLCRPVDFGSNCAVDELEEMEILVDAFNQGDIMFIEEVEDILARNSGLAEGQKVQIDRSFLRETKISKRAFLTRMLTNLRAIYDVSGDDKSTLLILEYMMVCNPYESLRVPLTKALGLSYFKNQRWVDASETLVSLRGSGDVEVDAVLQSVERILALESDAIGNGEDDDDDSIDT